MMIHYSRKDNYYSVVASPQLYYYMWPCCVILRGWCLRFFAVSRSPSSEIQYRTAVLSVTHYYCLCSRCWCHDLAMIIVIAKIRAGSAPSARVDFCVVCVSVVAFHLQAQLTADLAETKNVLLSFICCLACCSEIPQPSFFCAVRVANTNYFRVVFRASLQEE